MRDRSALNIHTHLDREFGHERVLGGVACIATSLLDDGVISDAGRNDVLLVGARRSSQEALATSFIQRLSNIPGERRVSQNIDQALWEKWVMICAGAAMCCLMRGTVGEIFSTAAGAGAMRKIIGDCCAVAEASGHPVSHDAMRRTESILLDPKSTWAGPLR